MTFQRQKIIRIISGNVRKIMSILIIILILLSKETESVNSSLHVRRLQDGQFPYLVQFQTISACGGVLLRPDWVLTAAQCVMFKRSAIFLHLAGVNDYKLRAIGLKATYIHPNYDSYSQSQDYEHNIALLKLSDSYEISKINRPLQIAPPKLDDNYQSCFIFGWQSTVFPNSRVFAKPVQYTDVLPNAWKICTYAQGIYGTFSNRENIFCAMIESDEGLKACAGNPGTPVVCENQNGRSILLGIASWTNYSLYCSGLPTYLSVAPFSSWIHGLISSPNKSSILNSTSHHESEIKMKNSRGDIGEFENNEESETETSPDFDDYREPRDDYKDSIRNVHDDYPLYYISAAKSVILSSRVVLWFSQILMYFTI